MWLWLAALVALVSQAGMQQVVLRGEHGLAAPAVSEGWALGTELSCERWAQVRRAFCLQVE
jgi:hypothetical protein